MNLWLPEGLPRDQQIDAEKACLSALAAWERRTEARLCREDREDALQVLREAAWLASRRFDPARGVPFRNFLFTTLYHRATDWIRVDEGRSRWQFSSHTYERERQVVLSLNSPTGVDERELGDLVAAEDSGDAADRDAAFEWLERTRDSERARDLRVLRSWLLEETPAGNEPVAEEAAA